MSIIDDINGFQLFEIDDENTEYDGEWVTIIKNKNELPYAKLKCSILYYERATSGTGGSGTTAEDKMFYRKNDSTGAVRQYGWMRGFPLFDIGDTANWAAYGKILATGWNYADTSEYYYRPPTINLTDSTKKHLIVLDFQNLPNSVDGANYLRGDLKYLVLRLKWSEEHFISSTDGGSSVTVGGKLWFRRWYTYTYYCDIVNPTECLDFNIDLFRMKYDSVIPGNDAGPTPIPWWATVNGVTKVYNKTSQSQNGVNGYTNLTAGVLLYPKLSDITDGNFPTYNEGGVPPDSGGDLPGYFQICVNKKDSSSPPGASDGNCINYWDDIVVTSTYPPDITATTSGWLTTIDIAGTGNNQFGPDPSGTYIFKNALWYSLQSTVWMDISYNKPQGANFQRRYIINFEDISGGYGRDKHTIDMTRGTADPYYSSSNKNGNNTHTYNEWDDDPALLTTRQYASNDNPFTTENYYDIFFKLLILPKSGNTVNVKYTFGQNENNSVVTFWRGVDPSSVPWCDGTADPAEITNSEKAVRSSESITLKWDHTVDASKNIPIKRIRFIDIAAGAGKSTPTISQTAGSTEAIFNDLPSDSNLYDISTNVFQIRLRDENYAEIPGANDYDQTRAMIKSLNIALGTSHPHKYLIDQVPVNYIPYRMLPATKVGVATIWPLFPPPVLNWTDNGANTSFPEYPNYLYFNPWKLISDPNQYSGAPPTDPNATLLYETNNKKIFLNDNVLNSTSGSSNILFNYTTTTDNSFNLYLAAAGSNTQDYKAIIIGKLNNDPADLPETIRPMSGSLSGRDKIGRLNPTTLGQANAFIPDYWQWNARLSALGNIFFSTGAISDGAANDIRKFENQITSCGVIEPINVTVNQQYMLINTWHASQEQINIKFPTPMPAVSNQEENVTISFVGGTAVSPPIGAVPPAQPALMRYDLSGVSLPDISGTTETKWPLQDFSEDCVFTQEENVRSLAKLFRSQDAYVDRTTKAERVRWNNLYQLNIEGRAVGGYNPNFATIDAVPRPIYVNCVELPPPQQLNNFTTGPNAMLNSANTKVTIKWRAYYFTEAIQGDIYWSVMRTNINTLKTIILLSDKTITLSAAGEYEFIDDTIRIYDKYYYTVSGVFKWKSEGLTTPLPISLSLPVGSFRSGNLIVCINNQFPFGRYNTTSTNLKLYRPLRLTAEGGQCSEVDEFGNTSGRCTGGVCQGLVNGVMQNLYNPGRSNGGTRNIYHNTTNQLTGKQIYVLLAKSASRPFR